MIRGVSFSKLQAVIAAIVVAGSLAAAWIYTRRQPLPAAAHLRHTAVAAFPA